MPEMPLRPTGGTQTHPGRAQKQNWILHDTNTNGTFIFWILYLQKWKRKKNSAYHYQSSITPPEKPQNDINLNSCELGNISFSLEAEIFRLKQIAKALQDRFPVSDLFTVLSILPPRVRAVCLSAVQAQLSKSYSAAEKHPAAEYQSTRVPSCTRVAIITRLEMTIWGKL